MTAIPFFDLNAVSGDLLPKLDAAATAALRSTQIILGPETARFETDFAAWMGAAHCVGVANGTDALTLALWATGVQPGSTVVVPALTAPPTAAAVLRAGMRPVFADVDPDSLTLDPDDMVRAAREAQAAAVLPVHLYGGACAMPAILDRAAELGLTVIEDCAQSTGSTLDGKHLGRFGQAAGCSFYPTKNLGCYGDGGAVLTDDPDVAARLRRLRFYGQDATGECVDMGMNSRLDEIQAALLSIRLKRLDADNARRREIAARYDAALDRFDPVALNPGRVPHLYVARVENRAGLRAHLDAAGIGTGIHYGLPLNRHAHLARSAAVSRACPVAEMAASLVLSLPCRPGLTDADVERVIESCLAWS